MKADYITDDRVSIGRNQAVAPSQSVFNIYALTV